MRRRGRGTLPQPDGGFAMMSERAWSELVERAFAEARAPRWDEMLFPRYRTSEDAVAMASAFHGRPWTSLATEELFEHREMLSALSPMAFAAIAPAYLVALMSEAPEAVAVRGDLQDYLLACLIPWPHQQEEVTALTIQRLEILSAPQREAFGVALDVLAARGSADAATVLRSWGRTTTPTGGSRRSG